MNAPMDQEARPNGGVLITFRDMYAQLQALVSELREVNHLMKSHGLTSSDHELRLRALERWRYGLPVALLVSLISAVAAVLSVVLR